MNLGTLNNQFHFNLPLDFMPPGIEERYMKLLGSKRKLYSSVLDYLNSTIQSITHPRMTLPLVSNPQILKRKRIKWKSVTNVYDLFEETITVTFRSVDSNINYIILQDILTNHYQRLDKAYDAPLITTIIDENRNALFHIQYRDVMWTDISGITFGFNDNTIQNATFTLTFEYNFIDYEYVIDKIDIISENPYNTLDINPPQ